VCEQIEKKVLLQQGQERGAPITVDSTYVGGKEGMLALVANFYLNSIKGLPPKMQNRARATLEELLLTENGKRRSTLEDELLKKLDRDSLQLLQQKRLIRSESRERNFTTRSVTTGSLKQSITIVVGGYRQNSNG
jgi:hypothetical protein